MNFFYERVVRRENINSVIEQILIGYKGRSSPVILDIGSGDGRYANLIRKVLPDSVIHCYDLQNKPQNFDATNNWYVGDAWEEEDFPLFNFCLISSAIYYNRNWDKFLDSLINKSCKDDGAILITMIGTSGWHNLFRNLRAFFDLDSYCLDNIHKITCSDLEKFCSKLSLQMTYICSFGGYILRNSRTHKSLRLFLEYRYHNAFLINKIR